MRCSAGYREPSSTRNASAEIPSMRSDIAQPCNWSPDASTLSTSMSSVPCSLSLPCLIDVYVTYCARRTPMSRVPLQARALATLLTIASIVAPAAAQPADGGLVLSAKLDAEGLSQMLIPIRVQGHTFWCSADSGNNRVLSLDIAKALNAGLQPNTTGTNAGVGPEIRRDQRIRGVDVEIGPVVLRDLTIVLVPQPTVVPDIEC